MFLKLTILKNNTLWDPSRSSWMIGGIIVKMQEQINFSFLFPSNLNINFSSFWTWAELTSLFHRHVLPSPAAPTPHPFIHTLFIYSAVSARLKWTNQSRNICVMNSGSRSRPWARNAPPRGRRGFPPPTRLYSSSTFSFYTFL